MTLDIAAIKARAEKATGAFITCVAGDGKPYVKFQFKELKAAQSFYAAFFDGRTDIPALIAALEASETARVKAEQERDALKEALTNSCDLLESYIDTFGDMSGANRADLNDYRRALEAKP